MSLIQASTGALQSSYRFCVGCFNRWGCVAAVYLAVCCVLSSVRLERCAQHNHLGADEVAWFISISVAGGETWQKLMIKPSQSHCTAPKIIENLTALTHVEILSRPPQSSPLTSLVTSRVSVLETSWHCVCFFACLVQSLAPFHQGTSHSSNCSVYWVADNQN